MPLAEAEALIESPAPGKTSVPKTHFQAIDEKADLEALQKLAVDCQRFTPQFGMEESESPECLLLDVTGCTHLFGGDLATAAGMASGFREGGFRVRVGMAPTIGAAWAVAHFLAKPALPVVVPPQQLAGILQRLPVKSLRLTPNILDTLRELGLRTVGQLQALPRASIPSRFGSLLLKRLDQAFGDEPEFFVIEKPCEPLVASWEGEFPIKDRESLHLISRQLLDQLLGRLKSHREGLRQLRCELRDSLKRSHPFLVGFTAPTDHPGHTFEMLCLQWEQVALPEEIDFVQLEAAATGPLQTLQRDLFGHELNADSQRDVVVLLDRLSNRLGAHSVVRARLLPDAQPELAVAYEPWAGPELAGPEPTTAKAQVKTKRTLGTKTRETDIPRSPVRPTRLFSPPESIEVSITGPEGDPVSFWWDHREHRVIRSWPERIETSWWRESPARRDYFRVEVQTGHHFWIFCLIDERGWFIHGVFD